MPKIVVIDRLGELKTVNVKDINADNLYKKAGLKSGEGFVLQHTWSQEDGIDQSIELYGKTKGKAGQENKYDFPPPVDSALFFGPCVLLGKDASTGFVVDLDEDEWEEIYEFLFGGFEDIDTEDSDDEDDIDTDDEVAALSKSTGTVVAQTKNGYVKDGFIVSDEDADDDYEESEEESEEERPKKRASKKTTLAKSIAAMIKPKPAKEKKERSTKEKESAAIQEFTQPLIHLEDCESELSEESYV
jgi:hypothetical protein